MPEYKAYIEHFDYNNRVMFALLRYNEHAPNREIARISWEDAPDGAPIETPTLQQLSRRTDGELMPVLQAIVDAAYDIGVRPAQAADERGRIQAMEEHIKSLRTANEQLAALAPKAQPILPLVNGVKPHSGYDHDSDWPGRRANT